MVSSFCGRGGWQDTKPKKDRWGEWVLFAEARLYHNLTQFSIWFRFRVRFCLGFGLVLHLGWTPVAKLTDPDTQLGREADANCVIVVGRWAL